MNAPLSILLNKSIFYNKKIAILFFISLSLLVFVTFFDKGFEISRGNLFLISTLYFGISISLYWLIKEKNYEFHKYSFNIDEYRLSSKKDKEKSYNEVYNKLLSEGLKNINSNTSKKIDDFLSNVQNELNKNLRKLITFERFDDYFTRPKKDETTSRLFYFQYKKSLIKIIKDFIVNTNELEDISNEIISRFISELTNYKNLHFEKDLGLHYHDKFAFEFLEREKLLLIRRKKYSDLNQNNITKDLFREGMLKIQNQISQSNNLLINNMKEVIAYLKNNVTKELFIKEKSKIQNQISQSNNLLINNRNELKIFFENNITKDLFIQENQKTKLLISSFREQSQKNGIEILTTLKKKESKIEQESIILKGSTLYENEQLKIENISIFNFYRVLSKSIEEICDIKLNRKENRELKSFVGIHFNSNDDGKISFEKEFKNLSFTNNENYKSFISILKYLTDLHYIEIQNSKLSRILTKCIPEKSFTKRVKNRTDSIRQCYMNNNLSKKESNKIDCVLQLFLNNKI